MRTSLERNSLKGRVGILDKENDFIREFQSKDVFFIEMCLVDYWMAKEEFSFSLFDLLVFYDIERFKEETILELRKFSGSCPLLGCSSIRKNEHFLFKVQNCSYFEITKEKFNFPFEDSTEFQELSKVMETIEKTSTIDLPFLKQYERGTVDYDVSFLFFHTKDSPF
jgi:hypothetical protein